MYLSDAPNGASFRVIRVLIGKEVGKRLADMGFTEGAEGAVVRGGLFRGPLQVRIRGYDVLIRRSEAAGIEVEPVGDWTAVEDANRLWGPFGRFGRHGKGRFGGPGAGGMGRFGKAGVGGMGRWRAFAGPDELQNQNQMQKPNQEPQHEAAMQENPS
uniref:Ferrous iron transport protein A n=1 Tax=Gracilinema caldarium TaxID=215591 RepID=A0A7C3IKD9_9SPIR